MSKKNEKIFIQIAAYRDPELLKTLRDCIDKAENPNNLVFSLCWQHDENESLEEFVNDKRFKIIDIDYRQSQGVCWARNLLQKQYDGEKYTLQLDSHHRFAQNWDTELISALKWLQKEQGSKKPLLCGYLPSYDPERDPEGRVMEPWKLDFDRFLPQGAIFLKPSTIPMHQELKAPIPARFYGAHFAFTIGDFVKEVPHDPNYYFLGEEISISARAYTWGYDLFHLHKVLIWHEYGRNKKTRQWDDDKEWEDKDIVSHSRNRQLLRIDDEVCNTDFGPYGLGPVRSIEEYEAYAGLDFKKRRVHTHTYNLHIGAPPFVNKELWDKNWFSKFRYCIDLQASLFAEKDYDMWAIAFKDSKDQEIIRIDAHADEINNLVSGAADDGWIRLWREFDTDSLPYSYVVWPHSVSKGWLNRVENSIPCPPPKIPLSPDPESLWTEFGKRKQKVFSFNKNPNKRKIFIHLPAYREPELVPTIKDAIKNAKNSERLVFGICRQFNPNDTFDNVDEFRNDKRFKIIDMPYEKAKGLAYARYQINTMLENEEYILQLDSHHRFAENWDETLIDMHDGLKKKGVQKPILGGYLPIYDPKNDPAARANEPWQSIFSCFYPHGTIFIRPMAFQNWQSLTEPVPARFLSGHFSFADNHWGKTIKHDSDIFFSGEEINLTVRSFTHGYDIFHPHKVVIWHATMRNERDGILVWDDQFKRGEDCESAQRNARAKIRQLLKTQYNGYDLTGYDLGSERTLHDYERFAGICFKNKSVQEYTANNEIPPNPPISDEDWYKSLKYSFYHLVDIGKESLSGNDYDNLLIAFDDKDGNSINTKYINGQDLQDFIDGKARIHYEEFFLTDRKPKRVVYWPFSNKRGWVDRIQINL
jgi:hypothetical protein